MNEPDSGWLTASWSRLSTGVKLLLLLSVGLLPFGLIAVLASVESARENRFDRAEATRVQIELAAQRINTAVARSTLTIRAASAAVALSPRESGVCETTLVRLARAQNSPGRYALYGSANDLRCATPGFVPPPMPAAAPPGGSVSMLSDDGAALRFALFGEGGRMEGSGEFSRDAVARIALGEKRDEKIDLELIDGPRLMVLQNEYEEAGPLGRPVELSEPILGGGLELRIRAPAVPVSASEILTILIPLIMWMGAAVMGWYIVNRLLLRPLVRMQRAVSSYQPGDRQLDLPTLSTPAREIGELGIAFDQVTQTVARHEADLEAAIERQTRLVREVHHRVKNNLQVVASLINLHARGAKNEDVAAAYASIQRRVDALAVVHRNHFAELEENRGVALKSLIPELCANLKATAPASASGMQIRLDIAPLHVTQDVALSVAFLLTEIIEFAMFCGARAVAITLDTSSGTKGKSRLMIDSESLAGTPRCEPTLAGQFERIVTGLARQLRSTLNRDEQVGRYSVEIPVLDW